MVSDVEIVRRLTIVVQKSDLSTITVGAIRKELERDLRVDLSDKKAFIREQVDLYLKEQQQQQELQESEQIPNDEGGNGEEEGDEEGEEDAEDDAEEQEPAQDGGMEVEDSGLESKRTRRQRGSKQEPDSKRFRAKIDRAIKASLPEKKKRAGGAGGLNKVCGLSPELQAIIGETELPRTQVVKQLWVYIKEKDLQAPENRRKIVCDEQLRVLFGVDSTDIFKMNKLLSKHIWPLDRPADGETVKEPKVKKPKTEKKESDRSKSEKETSDKPKVEKKDGGRGRNASHCRLSDALVEFLGTDETEMPQTDVMKHMWDYIAAHKLQDPADRRTILCDDKLEDLFQCESFVGFDLTKLLAPHLKG